MKITDFGFSTTKSRSRGQAAVGTPCWMAPEIFAGQPFREAADVYSFGIVLWEVAAWEAPFAALTEEQVRARVAAGQRPDVAAAGGRAAPRGMVELMERCWAQRCVVAGASLRSIAEGVLAPLLPPVLSRAAALAVSDDLLLLRTHTDVTNGSSVRRRTQARGATELCGGAGEAAGGGGIAFGRGARGAAVVVAFDVTAPSNGRPPAAAELLHLVATRAWGLIGPWWPCRGPAASSGESSC